VLEEEGLREAARLGAGEDTITIKEARSAEVEVVPVAATVEAAVLAAGKAAEEVVEELKVCCCRRLSVVFRV
jgi:hypothetical protein